jgi:hypothetical protein
MSETHLDPLTLRKLALTKIRQNLQLDLPLLVSPPDALQRVLVECVERLFDRLDFGGDVAFEGLRLVLSGSGSGRKNVGGGSHYRGTGCVGEERERAGSSTGVDSTAHERPAEGGRENQRSRESAEQTTNRSGASFPFADKRVAREAASTTTRQGE